MIKRVAVKSLFRELRYSTLVTLRLGASVSDCLVSYLLQPSIHFHYTYTGGFCSIVLSYCSVVGSTHKLKVRHEATLFSEVRFKPVEFASRLTVWVELS